MFNMFFLRTPLTNPTDPQTYLEDRKYESILIWGWWEALSQSYFTKNAYLIY